MKGVGYSNDNAISLEPKKPRKPLMNFNLVLELKHRGSIKMLCEDQRLS